MIFDNNDNVVSQESYKLLLDRYSDLKNDSDSSKKQIVFMNSQLAEKNQLERDMAVLKKNFEDKNNLANSMTNRLELD